MSRNDFTGTGALLRLFLRWDRWILLIWVLLAVGVMLGQTSFVAAMPDWRELMAELTENPVAGAMLGPIDPLSIEGAVLWRGMIQSAMVLIIACGLTGIRHTRTEEESGRRELLLGRPVGRLAHLTAAILFCAVGSAGVGLLSFLALIGNGFGAGGALIAALTLTLTGCVFGAVGGLLGQICKTASSAKHVLIFILGINYAAMISYHLGIGSLWVWPAPFIWYRLTRPYAGNLILPLLGFVLIAAALILIAYRVALRRDLGAGLLRQRENKREILHSLGSVWSLVWLQQRNALLVWAVGLSALGFVLGLGAPSIAEGLSGMFTAMTSWGQAIAKLGTRQSFVAICLYVLLMGGLSVWGISHVLHLRREESEGYAELLLSRPVSRAKWMGGTVVIGFANGVILLAALGLFTGLGWALGMGDLSLVPHAVMMCLTKIPSLWFLMGISALLYGWIPKLAGMVSWVLLGIFIVIEMMWEAGIASWAAMRFSPLSYAHYSIPIEELPLLPLVALTLLAGGMVWLGMIGFKQRNLQ